MSLGPSKTLPVIFTFSALLEISIFVLGQAPFDVPLNTLNVFVDLKYLSCVSTRYTNYSYDNTERNEKDLDEIQNFRFTDRQANRPSDRQRRL